LGENAVLQYGWDTRLYDNNTQNQQIVKTPHYDIIGYTVNVAVKMTGLAKPNQVAIGQLVYEALDEKQKLVFEILNVGTDVWSYVNSRTGSIYSIYTNVSS
jgi:adenylate cyclase